MENFFKNKKVLITGCNGLVGTYLVRQCIEKNYDVIGVDIADNVHRDWTWVGDVCKLHIDFIKTVNGF